MDDAVSSEQLKLEDFEIPYRKDRTNHGGGLLMYFNSNLAHVRKPDLETYCDESIWVQLKGPDNYLIGTFLALAMLRISSYKIKCGYPRN